MSDEKLGKVLREVSQGGLLPRDINERVITGDCGKTLHLSPNGGGVAMGITGPNGESMGWGIV